jgi:hypothetical protein
MPPAIARNSIRTVLAFAYFETFCMASRHEKYVAASTSCE